MRLGIFGGTFDPPHVGHLIVAQDAALALGLDRVLFVPAGAPPHKRERSLSPAPIRRAMVETAIAGNGRFAVEPLEVERAGQPSYTAETIEALVARHPEVELWLLLGADQWAEFATWHRPEAILRHARVAVIRRGGSKDLPSSLSATGGHLEPRGAGAVQIRTAQEIRHIATTRIDISSSEIRRRVGVGESVRYIVPDGVIEIIFREQLYR